jgi:hypothetical protein
MKRICTDQVVDPKINTQKKTLCQVTNRESDGTIKSKTEVILSYPHKL